MDGPDSAKKLREKVSSLELQLTETRRKLESNGIELEANEGLLRLAMDDMRHIYEELIRSQTQLMQLDKLATIGLLSAGIVHEINNPLSALTLVFTILSSQSADLKKIMQEKSVPIEGPGKQLFQDIDEFIEQGRRCSVNIAKIVTSIRTFSRSDKGISDTESVNTIIDNVIGVVWNAVKNRVKIIKEYGDVPKIQCNAQQLGQVFLNLLVNASQAMDSQGTITVRTSSDGKNVCVKVIDTGCGIPPEAMANIFEPFYTTKGAEEGTGLGLCITRDVIRKHSGDIQVESTLGKGTTFTILLPIT